MDRVIDDISVEVAVVLGYKYMPVHQLLRMGRGAVIELEQSEYDEVHVLANNQVIARGEVVVSGEKIAIQLTHMVRREELRLGLYRF